jgi:hypothetical protein
MSEPERAMAHNQVAEFLLYGDITAVNNCLEQFADYMPVYTFAYVDFVLRHETDELWWVHAPRLYETTACGGIRLSSVPDGTLLRAVDFAGPITKLALQGYAQRMQTWLCRFGLLQPLSERSTFTSVVPPGPSNADIMRRLDGMLDIFGEGFDDIKQSQTVIYDRINQQSAIVIEKVLEEVRQQRIEQGTIQATLDAIRRVLQHIQDTGLRIADDSVTEDLATIYRAINSDLALEQQLKLALPIIPFLLSYEIKLEAGVDLSAVWGELARRIQNTFSGH